MIPIEHTPTLTRVDSVAESFSDQRAAARARLRSVPGVHRNYMHASFFRFAVQCCDELAPGHVMDGLRQHRACESANVEVFVRNEVEALAQVDRELAVEVETLVAGASVSSADRCSGSTSAV